MLEKINAFFVVAEREVGPSHRVLLLARPDETDGIKYVTALRRRGWAETDGWSNGHYFDSPYDTSADRFAAAVADFETRS